MPVIEHEHYYAWFDMILTSNIINEDVFSYYYFNFLSWICKEESKYLEHDYYPNLFNDHMLCPCTINSNNGIPKVKFAFKSHNITETRTKDIQFHTIKPYQQFFYRNFVIGQNAPTYCYTAMKRHKVKKDNYDFIFS